MTNTNIGLSRGLESTPELKRWLLELAGSYQVLTPVEKGVNRVFAEISPGLEVVPDAPQERTVLPAKKAFLPPEEPLFGFEKDLLKPPPQPPGTVIFGLRVCELSADRLLTAAMESGPGDYPFTSRRRLGFTIGVPCRRSAACFCEKTGHDRIGAGDFDLFLASSEEGPVLWAGTVEGRELAQGAPFPVRAIEEEIRAPVPPDSQAWPLDALPGLLRESFGATMWEELATRCLGCGNCTVVCPLCYCFFTRDETGWDPSVGRRLRHWDSCQLVAFARVAGGHNFREARSERIWYRFSHKFMRMQEAFARPGCSGCGACLHFCPVDIDPRRVIEAVLEVTGSGQGAR